MTAEEPTTWETYEDVARYLLEKMGDTLGLGLETVEGKQKLVGKSGMKWAIDGKGVKTDGEAIVVIECRRYTTSKLKPEAMGGLAYRIGDVGAAGGIVVTPIGVQPGGEKIAKHEGIEIIHLDADSTTTDYVLRFLDKVFIGASVKPQVVTFNFEADGYVSHSDKPAPSRNLRETP
jgi:hypothetical protein